MIWRRYNAAEFLHTNKFDAVILQHEFGIFGQDGDIIQLLNDCVCQLLQLCILSSIILIIKAG